jgi:hypothetical protein
VVEAAGARGRKELRVTNGVNRLKENVEDAESAQEVREVVREVDVGLASHRVWVTKCLGSPRSDRLRRFFFVFTSFLPSFLYSCCILYV